VNKTSKIALFIDADNAPAAHIEFVLTELATYGSVNIRRAYGNWKNPGLKSWEACLNDNSIQPIQQFDLTKGKNATDIALVIDVMDSLYTKDLDVICLFSSDCDFTPLARRAMDEGKIVIGFGERKTPSAFVNSCSKFLYLGEKKEEVKPERINNKVINLLKQAVNSVEEDDGWALLNMVGSHIGNHTSFDARNYGFNKLSELFKSINLFEMKKTEGNIYRVKLK